MKNTLWAGAVAAPLMLLALSVPAYADSTCKDGTTSTATGKGTCSGHGGVQKAAKAGAAPAAASSGATAKCKDGTTSNSKSHSGACSKHGGVAEWLTPGK